MRSFDDIQVRRLDLAKTYLALLEAQPGRPLAMFAPRRVGKTFFLDHDLTPTAQEHGLLPVYADLWNHKADPLQAINHALEEALDDINVPNNRAARLGRTPVRKIGLIGASVDLGDAPARRALPVVAELRLDALIVRVANAAKKPVLLMLDEVQTLADAQGAAGAPSRRCAPSCTSGARNSDPFSRAPPRKVWPACCRPPARRCTSSRSC